MSLLESSSFEPNAILRGAQLTIVGANRALRNPKLFTSEHYRQAAMAVAAGVAIRLIVAIPSVGIRLFIRFLALFTDLTDSTWDQDLINGLEFIEHSVLQVPFFLMTFMRYLSPTLDNMFMDSLAWVDKTYMQKHQSENPEQLRAMYYPNLKLYDSHGSQQERDPWDAAMKFLKRFGKKAALSLSIYMLSFLPYVGRFVLPAASFYTFNKEAGLQPAVLIFGSALFLPKKYLVMFLQSFFSSRSLMRELLEPYFARVQYSPAQRRLWFHDRTGVLYGFAVAFFVFLKIPLLGVLIYGVAEASTAYLITKITDPPPPPAEAEEFKKKDVRWENKHEFLNLPVGALDAINVKGSGKMGDMTNHPIKQGSKIEGRKFT